MSRLAYAYLHGLGSGPASRKGAALAAAYAPRGIVVHVPDLNVPSARELSIHAMEARWHALDDSLGRPQWRLAGSSLGGWLVARFAASSGRVERAALLSAPMHLRGLWDRVLSETTRAQWLARGSMLFPDVHGRMRRVGRSFYDDVVALGEAPSPPLPCPSLFVHGTRDTLLPLAETALQCERSGGELLVLDDDHELTGSIPLVTARVVSLFDGP